MAGGRAGGGEGLQTWSRPGFVADHNRAVQASLQDAGVKVGVCVWLGRVS